MISSLIFYWPCPLAPFCVIFLIEVKLAVHGADHSSTAGGSATQKHRVDNVPITGKNTFAVPRAVVKPLGWTANEPKTEEGDEKPKSNDEFRKMFIKK